MRTLKLTHEEIELILNSLEYMCGSRMDIAKKNRALLDDEEIKSIIKVANKYDDLWVKIENSEKDV